MAKVVAVLTTIHLPTPPAERLARQLARVRIPLLAFGDSKGPESFEVCGAEFFSFFEQQRLSFRLTTLLPANHYARKNLGYLLAIARGATVILDVDDDNFPLPGWKRREYSCLARPLKTGGWFNVYSRFTDAKIWPRGFPLQHLGAQHTEDTPEIAVDSSIQQCLVNGAPDVDAIWRLVFSEHGDFRFDQRPSLMLEPHTWCPFNSQATWWFSKAFPLLYLPMSCSPRVSDIWRSLVAQRCLWPLGEGVVFHAPDFQQERNPHQLLTDFGEEIPMYLHNSEVAVCLGQLELPSGESHVMPNMRRCYTELVRAGFLPEQELRVVNEWFDDIHEVRGRL